MLGAALYKPIPVEISTFVKVTNVLSRANFGSSICRGLGLVSAKGRFLGFS